MVTVYVVASATFVKRVATPIAISERFIITSSIRPEEAERTSHEDRHLPASHRSVRTVLWRRRAATGRHTGSYQRLDVAIEDMRRRHVGERCRRRTQADR